MMALGCGGCANCSACRAGQMMNGLGALGAISVKSGKTVNELLKSFPVTLVVPINGDYRPYSDVFYASFIGYLKALSTKWNIKKPFLRADVQAVLAGAERENQALSWDYIAGRMLAAWVWLTFEDMLTALKAANANRYPALETAIKTRLNQISRDVNTLEDGFSYILQTNLGITDSRATASQIYSALIATVIRTYEIAVLVNSYKIANLTYGYQYGPDQLRELIRARLQGTPPAEVAIPDEVPEATGDSASDEAAAKASAGGSAAGGSAGSAAAGKDTAKDNKMMFLLLGAAAIGGYWWWRKNKKKKAGLVPPNRRLAVDPKSDGSYINQ
jgi:hypothetical protein